MNWDALQAVSELAGAIGVIASLLYAAAQVRKNAAATRGAVAHDVIVTTSPLLLALADDGELSSIWRRGLADFHSLNLAEQVRVSGLLLLLTYSYDEVYHAFNSGQINEWAYERFAGVMNEIARLPGFKTWFDVRKGWLSTDIKEHLEIIMKLPAHDSPFY